MSFIVRQISDRFARKERVQRQNNFDENDVNYERVHLYASKARNPLADLEIYRAKDGTSENLLVLASRRRSAKTFKRFVVAKHFFVPDLVVLHSRLLQYVGVLRFVPRRTASSWLEKCLELIDAHPNWRAYHLAAQLGVVGYFRKRNGRFYNMPAITDGLTPVMMAVREDHFELVFRLIEFSVELRALDNEGKCVLDYAKESDTHMLELLAESLPEEFTLLWCAENKSGKADYLTNFLAQISPSSSAARRSPLYEALTRSPTSPLKMGEMLSAFNFDLHNFDLPSEGTWLHAAQNKRSLLSLLEMKRLKESELDTNARDKLGRTALMEHVRKRRHGFVLALYGYWTDVNVRDIEGNSALHYAVVVVNKSPSFKNEDLDMIKALICCGASVNARNRYGESPRHLAARTKSHTDIAALLAMKWAASCPENSKNCFEVCMHPKNPLTRFFGSGIKQEIDNKRNADDLEDPFSQRLTRHLENGRMENDLTAHLNALKELTRKMERNRDGRKVINALSLDGGGIRGLIITQVLMSLEEFLPRPLSDYFEWIGATSTGACLGASLTIGLSIREGQRIYLRFKDDIFEARVRPYDALILEKFYRSVFGDETRMKDTLGNNHFFCTTNDATVYPASLMLLRNYSCRGDALEYGADGESDLEIWRAVRRSSAAPTYFAASEQRYVDGGLSSNNPTMELLAEIQNWNAHCQEEDKYELGCVLSIGAGRTLGQPVDPGQIEMASMFGMVKGIRNLFNMVMAQVTATDGAVVTRSRAWTHSLGAAYYRLCPMMSKEYQLDAKDDSDVIAMMWECVVYAFSHRAQFEEIAATLIKVGPAHAKTDRRRRSSWSGNPNNRKHWRQKRPKAENLLEKSVYKSMEDLDVTPKPSVVLANPPFKK
ncbi:unnamed protein product, partial [Mesorhabditis spiculigera]